VVAPSEHLDMFTWPEGSRLICRPERPRGCLQFAILAERAPAATVKMITIPRIARSGLVRRADQIRQTDSSIPGNPSHSPSERATELILWGV
jgi:hypothetical protein